MAMQFVRFEEQHLDAVRRFNARMRAGGVEDLFLIEEKQCAAPASEAAPVRSERILAVDGEEVRGSYIVQWREYRVAGENRRLGNYQTPVSEGIIDKKHTAAGLLMTRYALSSNPYWYTVGMGGLERPLPRMLKSMGWHLSLVPFRFRIHRPARFFREIRHLRTTAARRTALNTLAWTGAGWAGVKGLELARRLPSHPAAGLRLETVARFDEWADGLWERVRDRFPFAGMRTAAHLNALYAPEDGRYRRVRISSGERLLGWAVLLRQPMKENKYFGNMTAGVLADCLAAPEDLAAVAGAASRAMEELDIDVAFANPLHAACLEGLHKAGFLAGPTNYGFGLSKAITGLLDPIDLPALHLMRGDGDGLSNFGANH